MLIGHRAKLNEAVVAFPTTKSAAAATIRGTILSPFEAGNSAGGANVVLKGDSVAGDTLTIKTYVSFTAGDTVNSGNWVQVDEDGIGHHDTYASGSVTARRFYIPYAPRVRVDAVFDSAATLSALHGLQIDVESLEYDPETARAVFDDCVTMGDTSWVNRYTFTIDGDTLNVNNPNKVLVWCRTANGKVVGDTDLTVNLQGSLDAENWWTIQALTTAIPSGLNTSGDSVYVNNYEIVERPDLPDYLRIQVAGDSSTYWSTGHGIKFYVVAYE